MKKTVIKICLVGIIFSCNYNFGFSQLKVSSAGNVGIGVTDPGAYKVWVQNGDYKLLSGASTSGTGSNLLRLFNNVGSAFSINSNGNLSSNLITDIGINYCINGGTGTNKYSEIGSKKSPIIRFDGNSGTLALFGESGIGSDWRTPVHNLGIHINYNGNVGIGSSNCSYGKLQINGSGINNGLSVYNSSGTPINMIHNSDDNAYIIRGTNTNAGMRFLNNGHVGINGYASSTYWFYVTGDCRADSWDTYSDSTAKTEIKDITISERIKELRPVSYKWKEKVPNIENITEVSNILIDNENEVVELCDSCPPILTNKETVKPEIIPEPKDTRIHYGFLAQEVKEVFPDVVTSDERGLLAINYDSFIPMLVDCYKKADSQIEELQQIVTKQQEEIQQLLNYLENSKKSYSFPETIDHTGPMLYQNSPNPFNINTIIKYEAPSILTKAMLNIYDLQGHQIESFGIYNSGSGEIKIEASSLHPGVYIYNLIIDGKEVDTKRMIITD